MCVQIFFEMLTKFTNLLSASVKRLFPLIALLVLYVIVIKYIYLSNACIDMIQLYIVKSMHKNFYIKNLKTNIHNVKS